MFQPDKPDQTITVKYSYPTPARVFGGCYGSDSSHKRNLRVLDEDVLYGELCRPTCRRGDPRALRPPARHARLQPPPGAPPHPWPWPWSGLALGRPVSCSYTSSRSDRPPRFSASTSSNREMLCFRGPPRPIGSAGRQAGAALSPVQPPHHPSAEAALPAPLQAHPIHHHICEVPGSVSAVQAAVEFG